MMTNNVTMKKVLLTSALLLVMTSIVAQGQIQRKKNEGNVSGNIIMVDATKTGEAIPNIVSNVNVWDMGSLFHNPQINQEANVFEFVRYVQFMQCSGGNAARDLFQRPEDRSTLTDNKFDNLIKNCRGVLTMGAKPHLKLGSVPLKLTTNPSGGTFGTNIYPPDDYDQYYTYIKAIAEALVKEFGLQEVRQWHFGCMTEYENYDWFKSKNGLENESCEAFCKLYDYTVQALIDVLGEDIYVGAHSMTVTEGGWDEARFIEHVASGTNYANGGKGTKISYLSASFYDFNPGRFTVGHDLPGTIKVLQDAANAAGLKNLKYGIDEGRILAGLRKGSQSQDLYNRTTGYTWQAAYDARLFKQGIDNGLDYFSSWNFLTGGNIYGYPIISYHVANQLAKFAGMYRADTQTNFRTLNESELDCLASTDSKTVRTMVYNFRKDPADHGKTDYTMQIKVPFHSRKAQVTRYLVNDDCNFFDEWLADCEKLGITSADFAWSPDDPMLDITITLNSESGIRKYKTMRNKYEKCSRLTPIVDVVDVKKGVITLKESLDVHNVMFLEIKPMEKTMTRKKQHEIAYE